jgi:multidrug efflux pump subunit AcrA (membrane-fusion protein)
VCSSDLKAEAERQAELERQEAERKAEEERQAEVKRQEELERQAEIQRLEEELAQLEVEAQEAEVPSALETTPDNLTEKQEPALQAEGKEETEAVFSGEEKAGEEEEVKTPEGGTNPGPEEESGPEPVVEEPLSPETQQEARTGNIIEEIQDAGIPEEEEQE